MSAESNHQKKFKSCELCGRPLPASCPDTLCPNCKDTELFHDVKDYVRANRVNEYEVAEHFGLSLKKVKSWIREGRLEYVETPANTLASVRCKNCGAMISFGMLCPKCQKQFNGNRVVAANPLAADTEMHYLDKGKAR
jgi:RNA polymerase subunit RPABC4/transcription elongation factor Spt4/ribosomal protein L32